MNRNRRVTPYVLQLMAAVPQLPNQVCTDTCLALSSLEDKYSVKDGLKLLIPTHKRVIWYDMAWFNQAVPFGLLSKKDYILWID